MHIHLQYRKYYFTKCFCCIPAIQQGLAGVGEGEDGGKIAVEKEVHVTSDTVPDFSMHSLSAR